MKGCHGVNRAHWNRMGRIIANAAVLGLLLTRIAANPSATAEALQQPAEESRPFPPERGRLRVEGPRFYDANNEIWRWRGATQFLLFARYLNGENITPQLDWLVASGFNVIRVFGEVAGRVRRG